MKVLEPGSGKTRTGRLWVYVLDDRNRGSAAPPAAWFAYSADRRGCHPQGHLAEWKGILQADAFAGYDALYESGRIRKPPAWRMQGERSMMSMFAGRQR